MLHFEITGNGKENLVLLHGFMENSKIWKFLEPHLSEKFTVIKIDLPGHGKSENNSEILSMEMMAREVVKVISELNLEKIHLLGHSMGGYVSLAFAELFPQKLKSLTLFFSTYIADEEDKKEQRRKSFRIIKDAFKHYVNAGIPNLFNPNEKDILEGKINFAKEIAFSTNNLGALAAVKGMIERTDKLEILKNLDAKILIISGKHDSAVNSEKTLKNLPDQTNIKSYVLDCGHMGQLEKPEICAAIINTELLHHLPKHLVF
ncbi:alpha/beta fold hydrolase [Halpernia frigidisoli]|uniref:Pimeloyl-ACP methyl ester carboxylesterase n=1 Tax=Halpernia frigidisoli TaxID=1125876 RepID=A0A1I3HZ60_9FLAO|nr:alpha/beta hydrolase [Halpernia frigidisoli]SFI40869.1 Pimeloyl-ACP methyl ester carboxylesterase [Halpernia frigidisoli]